MADNDASFSTQDFPDWQPQFRAAPLETDTPRQPDELVVKPPTVEWGPPWLTSLLTGFCSFERELRLVTSATPRRGGRSHLIRAV